MVRKSIDRRVARTRAALHEALVALIVERGYEATSVEEICDRANVGRSTFYAHYTGKDDLMRSGLKNLRDLLQERQGGASRSGDPNSRGFAFSLPMFEHARAHAHLHRALLGSRGGAIAADTIRDVLADLVRHDLAAVMGKNAKEAMPREFIVQYLVGAYMAVIAWWIDRGAKLAPERIDAMFRRLATEGIVNALR